MKSSSSLLFIALFQAHQHSFLAPLMDKHYNLSPTKASNVSH